MLFQESLAHLQSTLYDALVFDKAGSKQIYFLLSNLKNLRRKLSKDDRSPFRFYSNERVVEIRFVFEKLAYARTKLESEASILELGDVLARKLASDGNRVLLVDMNADSHPDENLTVMKENIAEAVLPASTFDVAISISTIEHIGLGAYNTPIFRDGDLSAMKILRDALKENGTLICTLPYGIPGQTTFKRVYDHASLVRLLDGFRESQIEFWKFDRFRWRRCSEEEAASMDSLSTVCAIALVHAQKNSIPQDLKRAFPTLYFDQPRIRHEFSCKPAAAEPGQQSFRTLVVS